MPSSRELRRRIKSVKNTAQITKAMEMVAATKMRRAQSQAIAGRPYNQSLYQIMLSLLKNPQETPHPLFSTNDSPNSAIVLTSTDKSLCGALNTNLFRALIKQFSPSTSQLFTVGSKGKNFAVKSNWPLSGDFPNLERPDTDLPRQIRKVLITGFLSAQFSKAYLLFPNFINTLTQTPTLLQILPIQSNNFLPFLENQAQIAASQVTDEQYLYEPSFGHLLDFAITHFLDVSIYQALLETKASEHSARMIAMQNASDNALDLVADLTLDYNQKRQEGITKELLEIVSAQAALE